MEREQIFSIRDHLSEKQMLEKLNQHGWLRQISLNLQHYNESKPSSKMGLITQANSIIRGYSRSSAHRGLTTGNVYAHPCTAESKKRQIPLQSNHSSSFTNENQLRNNVSLPSKRSVNQKQ